MARLGALATMDVLDRISWSDCALLEVVSVEPCQLAGTPEPPAEHRLLRAVLWDALTLAAGRGSALHPWQMPATRQAAVRWIHSDSRATAPFDIVSICEHLHYDLGAIRRFVARGGKVKRTNRIHKVKRIASLRLRRRMAS